MNRYLKVINIIFSIILCFSLMGCNTASQSTKNEKIVKNEAPAEKIIQENSKTETSSLENQIEIKKTGQNVESKQISEIKETSEPKKQTITENISTKVVLASKNTNIRTQQKSTNSKVITPSGTKSSTQTAIEPTKQPDLVQEVTISIVGSKDTGVILKKTKITFNEGDTIFDILLKATEKREIDVEFHGKGAMTYIEGIDNLYEFDYGPKSGWNFKLNGIVINKSSGSVQVKKDDDVEWIYLEDFTEEKG